MTDIQHSEDAFETIIETYLMGNRYVCIDGDDFEIKCTVFPEVAFTFIRDTQVQQDAIFDQLHNATEEIIALLKKRFAALMVPVATGQTDKREAL